MVDVRIILSALWAARMLSSLQWGKLVRSPSKNEEGTDVHQRTTVTVTHAGGL